MLDRIIIALNNADIVLNEQINNPWQNAIDNATDMQLALDIDPNLAHTPWYPDFLIPNHGQIYDENGNEVLNPTAQEIWDYMLENYGMVNTPQGPMPGFMILLLGLINGAMAAMGFPGDEVDGALWTDDPQNQLAILRLLFNPHPPSRFSDLFGKGWDAFYLAFRQLMLDWIPGFNFEDIFPQFDWDPVTGDNPIPDGGKYQPGVTPIVLKGIKGFLKLGPIGLP